LRATDVVLEGLLARLGDISRQATFLHERGDHLKAEAAERRAEALLREAETPDVLPTLVVPDPDGGLVRLPTPSRADLAAWLFLTPSPVDGGRAERLLTDQQRNGVERAHRDIGAYFRARRECADQEASGYVDRDAIADLRSCTHALQRLLERGLQQRLGQQLFRPELGVYTYLATLGIHPCGVRVCEDCLTVFAAQRAVRCLSCRRGPVRTSRRPWHTHIRPADRAVGSRAVALVTCDETGATLTVTINRRRGVSRTVYTGQCQVCDGAFEATDARARHCPACAAPAARVARSRARR
jgi:hypothetical protein